MKSFLRTNKNGSKFYENIDGRYHREDDLPAIEWSNGDKIWHINGKRHREIGPAAIYSDGNECWYLNDIEYLPEEMPSFLYVNYLRWEYKKKNKL